ncbi:MAG: chorismate mutase [Lachnospiraceae bacterium]|nr:chorismate mutase [Lachnospiraceae bacterium]
MDKLTENRQAIEEIDKKMAELFVKRMACSGNIAQYKTANGIPILDQGREKELIEKNGEYISDDVIKPYYMDFFKTVLDISKQYQKDLTERNINEDKSH